MKTITTRPILLLVSLILSAALPSRAQGTISLANGSLTKYTWNLGSSPVPVVFGAFWSTNANEMTMVLPLGTSSVSQAGIIFAPSTYPIPGTEPGQTVYLQIKGWAAAYGTNWVEAQRNFAAFGQTDVRRVTLGQTTGPGTVIWQSNIGANPSRFYPLVLGNPLTPPAMIQVGNQENIPVVVDEGNQGTVEAIIPVFRRAMGPTGDLNYFSSAVLSTTNMTALAGDDYLATNAVVTFSPGETLKHIRLTILADSNPESEEQFGVYLESNGSFVSLDQWVLRVTIREARLLSVRRTNGQSVIILRTTSHQHYTVEYSTNLADWAAVPGAFNITGNGANLEIIDGEAACCGHRFYRARLLPQ